MEILHRGTPRGERQHEGTCRSCSTRVRFKESEAKYESDQRDGDYWCVICPVCLSSITVHA